MSEHLERYREMRDFSVTPELIKRAELPQFIAPQLATLVTEAPRGGAWVYEVKHDGYLRDSWLDGEIVVPGPEGRSSFQGLQNAFDKGSDAGTAKIAKARRPNKIFVDYLRNSETASAVAAFSPRARPDAGVSVPLAWEELDERQDLRARFDVKNVPQRLAKLKKDPWAAYGETRQATTAKMLKALKGCGA